jgi:hypothetical protein
VATTDGKRSGAESKIAADGNLRALLAQQDDVGIVTLTWGERREGEIHRAVPVMLRLG